MTMTAKATVAAARQLEDAFRAEAPILLRYFLNRLATDADAADLVSETFLSAWKSSRRESIPPDMFRAWLFGIARKVLSQYRRAGARRSALADRLRDSLVAAPWELHRDDGHGVRELIQSLPEIDREIILLVYWDGFTQEEAAVVLRRPASTVRSRLTRARARLKQQLDSVDSDL